MNENTRNIVIAVVLSAIVLFGWQYFVAGPQMERAQKADELAQQQAQSQPDATT